MINRYLYLLLLLLLLSVSCIHHKVNIELSEKNSVDKLYCNSQDMSLEKLKNKEKQQTLLSRYELTKNLYNYSLVEKKPNMLLNNVQYLLSNTYTFFMDFTIATGKFVMNFTIATGKFMVALTGEIVSSCIFWCILFSIIFDTDISCNC